MPGNRAVPVRPCAPSCPARRRRVPVSRARRVGPAPACARSRRAGGGCAACPLWRCALSRGEKAVSPYPDSDHPRVETEIKKPQNKAQAVWQRTDRAHARAGVDQNAVFPCSCPYLCVRGLEVQCAKEGVERRSRLRGWAALPRSNQRVIHRAPDARGAASSGKPTRAASQGIPLCFEPLCLLLEEPSHGRETGGTNP